MENGNGTRGMFTRIPGNRLEDSGECSKRFWGMFPKIPGNVRRDSGECSKDSGECSRRFRGIFEEIPGNVPKDSGECWQKFLRTLKKIESFIMQLNENRIKQYILKYDKKCAQKFIKTSHVNENV